MVGFLALLVVLWIVLSVVGFVVKGLLWLGFLALVLVVVTVLIGAAKARSGSRG